MEIYTQLIKKFGTHYAVIGLSLVVCLLWGYLGHRSWRKYLSLLLPVAVIVIVAINFSLPPNWVLSHGHRDASGSLMESGTLYELVLRDKWFITRQYFYLKDYLKGKKIITSFDYYDFFQKARFLLTVDCQVVIQEYPHTLSKDEYTTIKKESLKTLQWIKPKLFSLFLESDDSIPEAEKVYVFSYEYDREHWFLLPEKYFLRLKKSDKTDLSRIVPRQG